jgi:hypothetical protein
MDKFKAGRVDSGGGYKMSGRIRTRDYRLYVGGYDLSNYLRNIGPLSSSFEEATDDTVLNTIKKTWPGRGIISPGTLNAIFDNTATVSIHAVLPTAGGVRNVMVPIGSRAAPAQGDSVFNGEFVQLAYTVPEDAGMIAATVPFGGTSKDTPTYNYAKAWGKLLHANGAETAANGAVGIDDLGEHTEYGGYMAYQVFTAAGTTTIQAALIVEAADTNTDAAFDSAGTLVTTGNISLGSGGVAVPTSGFVALAPGTHVHRYLRWQLALTGNCTSVTFALAFVRATHQ